MARSREDIVNSLLANPEGLLLKKPFTRGSSSYSSDDMAEGDNAVIGKKVKVSLPDIDFKVIPQSKFLKELDPESHEVMFDQNVPSICVKLRDDTYTDIKFKHIALPFQARIREKQTLSLCGNPRLFSMLDKEPTETQSKNFLRFKQGWAMRNQDGKTNQAVFKQKGLGDVGLLYYFDTAGRIKSRIISYDDGYVLIPHNDDNGDRVLECIYYKDSDGIEHIDSYDDTYMYRMANTGDGFRLISKTTHGFSEIPMATKRGDVAWNGVQNIIEAYEILYNIFLVIQKRHGWGILYVRGKFKDDAKRIAGSIILNDTSIDGKGSAEFKAPPTPEGILNTLESLYDLIQIGSSTTFLLPKDVKANGDVSGLAIMLTQSLDLEGANKSLSDWQNFLDKCVRLFKEGFAKELVNSGENKNAITEFQDLHISAKFKVWRPFSETEYNNMLCSMKNSGIISEVTAIEKNTIAEADELMRIQKQKQDQAQQEPAAQVDVNNGLDNQV